MTPAKDKGVGGLLSGGARTSEFLTGGAVAGVLVYLALEAGQPLALRCVAAAGAAAWASAYAIARALAKGHGRGPGGAS